LIFGINLSEQPGRGTGWVEQLDDGMKIDLAGRPLNGRLTAAVFEELMARALQTILRAVPARLTAILRFLPLGNSFPALFSLTIR
jgi:hypothetical protein